MKRIIWPVAVVLGLAAAAAMFNKVKNNATVGIEAIRARTAAASKADTANAAG